MGQQHLGTFCSSRHERMTPLADPGVHERPDRQPFGRLFDRVPQVCGLSVGVAVSGEVWDRLGDNEVLHDPTNLGVDAASQSLHGEAHACVAWLDDDAVRIRLHRPARGVAKGQAAVLYDGDTVLGSATITGTLAVTSQTRVPAGRDAI